jgi:hypothetical protein
MASKAHCNKLPKGFSVKSADMYKPLQYFGMFFVIISIAILFCLYRYPGSQDERVFLYPFAGVMSILHMLIGIGVLTRNKKIFALFKIYLKILYIGFPIGTFIARKTLTYIDKYDIERYLV